MLRYPRLATAGAVALTTLALAPSVEAAPSARTCRGSIVGAFVPTSVVVPPGATCRINRSTINGTITVGRGATLVMFASPSRGALKATGHARVEIRSSTIGGAATLSQGRAALILASNISGNLVLTGNRGAQRVSSNTIAGDLRCLNNVPAPIGGQNRAMGGKFGQCRRL